jgi:hypothetical protein
MPSGLTSSAQEIERALREHCNIPAKRFFLGVILEDGKTATFSGPGKIASSAISQFFDVDGFARTMQDPELGMHNLMFPRLQHIDIPFNSTSYSMHCFVGQAAKYTAW